jgi:hypothetical protein
MESTSLGTVEVTTGRQDNGPLSQLYDNKYKGKTLKYPSNLISERYPHHIQFIIQEPDPSKVPQIANGYSANLKQIEANNPSGKNPTEDPGFQGKDPFEKGTAIGEYALKRGGNMAAALAQVVATKDTVRRTNSIIALYIPDTVNVTYSPQYEDIALSKALGTPYFLAQAGASAYDAYKKASGGDISGIVNELGSNPYMRDIIGKALGSVKGLGIDGEAVSKLLNRSIGEAYNPQLQVLFQGVDFRRFQFDFTMTPSSAEEASDIREIVKAFRLAAAPEIRSGFNSMYLKVPDMVDVGFYHNGRRNDKVNQINTCVIENISVDYAPMGWSTHTDGMPVQTKLSLQLKEVGIIDKTQINEGY